MPTTPPAQRGIDPAASTTPIPKVDAPLQLSPDVPALLDLAPSRGKRRRIPHHRCPGTGHRRAAVTRMGTTNGDKRYALR
ncbi:MAG: hypothetical protein ACREX8_17590, partial [Gammaproteobacteria bacterium]